MPKSRFRKSFKVKRTYQYRDKKKLVVMAYLASIYPKGDTKHGIATKAKFRKQEPSDFANLMKELTEINWVDKKESEIVGGHDNYVTTGKGRAALNKAKELARDGHPLSSLDAFQNVLDL